MPMAGIAIFGRARSKCRFEESINVGLRLRYKTHVTAISRGCAAAIERCSEPKLRIHLAKPYSASVFHYNPAPQWTEQALIEFSCFVKVVGANRNVRNDGLNLVCHDRFS